MSIYPVKLAEWFPPGDDMFEMCLLTSKYSMCLACNKQVRYKSMVGYHSLCFGNGDVWCSWKCNKSGKVHTLDKRQRRKMNRLLKKNNYSGFIDVA